MQNDNHVFLLDFCVDGQEEMTKGRIGFKDFSLDDVAFVWRAIYILAMRIEKVTLFWYHF